MIIGVLVDGRYEIVNVLGGGAFGQTFLAKDTKRPGHPFCVVKQLRYSNSNPAALEHARRLFKKEAEILEKLGHHDQIPTLLADIEEHQEFYLVEQFVPGQPLTQEIVPGFAWDEQQVIQFLKEVLHILFFVHGQGVIHRDLKPANLMRRQPDDKVVLIDFGAVKELGTQIAGQAVPTIAIGTPGYMAIEQFNGQPQFNSDIYALGMIAIQALLGLAVDELSGLKDISSHPPGEIKWRHRRPVSAGLANLLDKMVLSDYRQRYQTASAVLNDLEKLGSTYFPESLVHQPPVAPSQSTILNPPTPTPDPAKATTVVPKPPAQEPSPQQPLQQASLQQVSLQQPQQNLPQPSRKARRPNRFLLASVTTIVALSGLAGIGYSQKGRVAEYFYNQGREKSRFGDVKGSLDNYNLAIQINPTYANAYARRCGSHLRLEDDVRAKADCQRAIALDADNTIANLNWGNYYTEQRDRTKADPYYTKAVELSSREIQLQPNNADAYYHRGAARLRLADYSGAIEDATKAIELDPQYVEAYITRCQAQGQLSNHEAAANDCKQAAELNPNHYVAYASLCNNLSNAGQYDAAIEACTQALQINPNDSYGYNNRGVVYLKMGNYESAINDYRQAIQRDAKDAVAYHNLADVLALQGDQQGAIEAYTNAIANNSTFAAAFYGRGLRQAAVGNTEAAINDLQQSADIYTQQGRQDRADDALYQMRVIQEGVAAQISQPVEEQTEEQATSTDSQPVNTASDAPAVVPVVQEPAPAFDPPSALPPAQVPVDSYVEEPPGYQYNQEPENPENTPPVEPDPYVQNPPVPYLAPDPYVQEPPAPYYEAEPPAQTESVEPAPQVQEQPTAPSEPSAAPVDSFQQSF